MKNQLFIVLGVFASACTFCFSRSYNTISAVKSLDFNRLTNKQQNNINFNVNADFNNSAAKNHATGSSSVTH